MHPKINNGQIKYQQNTPNICIAYYLNFSSDGTNPNYNYRWFGFAVRPVSRN